MFKYLPKNQRECPICHCDIEFEISLSIYRFKGNQDEMYFCPNCKYGLLVLVRFGEIWKKEVFIRNKTDIDED